MFVLCFWQSRCYLCRRRLSRRSAFRSRLLRPSCLCTTRQSVLVQPIFGRRGLGASAFLFYDGYSGPVVGFYGGIDYGFGYFGHGFVGGRWEGDHFFYNRAVWHVDNRGSRNVYEERVNVNPETRISYNGGRGGIDARPTREEEAATHERHLPPASVQRQHEQAARS